LYVYIRPGSVKTESIYSVGYSFTLVRPQLESASSVWDNSVNRNINKVELLQRNAARFTCHDYRRTSSVTDMLQKLQWDSLQQRRARSRVLMLYRIRNGLVAIPAAAYLEPVPICTRRFETRYVQIRCNRGTYSHSSFQVQSGCGTTCQSTFASYLLTVSRPISTASILFDHQTTSCF